MHLYPVPAAPVEPIACASSENYSTQISAVTSKIMINDLVA